MANYFIKDDKSQVTPTGTVTPTVQMNGKTESPADARVVNTPVQQLPGVGATVDGNVSNGLVRQQSVAPASNSAANNVQPSAPGAPQSTSVQVQPQNYFSPNTSDGVVSHGGQGEGQEQGEGQSNEGLSDDEKTMIALNDAIRNNYRKQYKEASDVTQGVFDYLNGGAQKEEEPYKKENESKKKLYALADAIRQIGNLAYVTKGATSQKFNNPVAEQDAKYRQEKALRDKDRAARADAAQKKAKMDADAAYKEALLAMKNNEFNRSVFNDYRKAKENADKFAWTKQKDQANLDLRGRQLDETAAYHKGQLRLGAQRVALARERNAIARSNAATARMRAVYEIQGSGGLGKGSKSYTTPEGVTYTLSKNFITPANVKTVYDTMVKRGVISTADQQAVSKDLKEIKAGIGGGSKGSATNSMLSAILSAATGSYKGHETFTFFGKRLGYAYRGGMNDALKSRLIKQEAAPSQKPQQSKPAAKAPSKPQQQKSASKPAPKKPATSQNGGQKKNKRSQLTI